MTTTTQLTSTLLRWLYCHVIYGFEITLFMAIEGIWLGLSAKFCVYEPSLLIKTHREVSREARAGLYVRTWIEHCLPPKLCGWMNISTALYIITLRKTCWNPAVNYYFLLFITHPFSFFSYPLCAMSPSLLFPLSQ